MTAIRTFFLTLGLLAGSQAYAQGTLNVALQQQFAFTGCSSAANVCGTPLIGGLLYFYQIGTVATRQDSFQDTGLTIPNPWPLQLDANGRVPMFYLASGSIHVRLTDAGGVVQFEYPSMLVVGPSGGGGGGGGGVSASSVFSTGDIKFRVTSEVLPDWVRLNGQTIGGPTSGATGRANADTQALFIYLWGTCPQAHCPIPGGRGTTALNDFNGTGSSGTPKQLTLPDWRGRGPMGLDDMGNVAAGRLQIQNMTGGEATTTPNAVGGEAIHTMTGAELVGHGHGVNDPGHSHAVSVNVPRGQNAGGQNAMLQGVQFFGNDVASGGTDLRFTGISIQGAGGSVPFNVMAPFMLGTWYIRL